jgi:hypothetical protein
VDGPTRAQNPGHAWSVVNDLIERAAEIRITQSYVLTAEHPPGVVVSGSGLGDAFFSPLPRSTPVFPAIAIPVEKKNTFECPQDILDQLVALLPKVSKILVIGWRATEAHFLALLKTNLRRGAELHIVAGPDAEDIKVRICRELLNNPPHSPSVDARGFTDFILTRRAEQFLAS